MGAHQRGHRSGRDGIPEEVGASSNPFMPCLLEQRARANPRTRSDRLGSELSNARYLYVGSRAQMKLGLLAGPQDGR